MAENIIKFKIGGSDSRPYYLISTLDNTKVLKQNTDPNKYVLIGNTRIYNSAFCAINNGSQYNLLGFIIVNTSGSNVKVVTSSSSDISNPVDFTTYNNNTTGSGNVFCATPSYSDDVAKTCGYFYNYVETLEVLDGIPVFTDKNEYSNYITNIFVPQSGGAGSGYIGNSSLVSYTSQKKMVGYNVTTSSAPDTKTESVQVYSSIAEVDKPKAGNGFVRIKFIKEPPLDPELVDMINGDGFFWKNWNASIVYGTYDTTMTWKGSGNYKAYTWVTDNGNPVTTSNYKTTTGGVAFIAVGAKQTLFINKTTNGYSGTISLGSRIANQWKGSGSTYWQDAKFAYKNGSTQWSDWPDGSVNTPGSLSYSAETINGVLEYFAKRLRNIYIAVDDNTLYSMAKTHSMTNVQGYVTSSIDESSVNNLSSYFGTDRVLRIEHSSWQSSYIRSFDGYTAGCDTTNGLVFTYSYIPINRTKVKSIRFKAIVPTQYGQQNAMIQVKTAYFSGNTMTPNAGSASWNPEWQGTWQEYVLSYTDPVNVDYIQIKTGYNDWYIKDVVIYKEG